MSGKTSERQLTHIKNYYKKNKEKILAQKKEYYQKNKERIKANTINLRNKITFLEQENEHLKKLLIKYMYGRDLEDSYETHSDSCSSEKSQEHEEGEDEYVYYHDDDVCYDENGMPTMGFLVYNK